MKLIIAGLGPGNPELITLSALNEAKRSEIIIVPRSNDNTPGIAEQIISQHMPAKSFTHILFPMINNPEQRQKIILDQILHTKSQWQGTQQIFFPVIGDSTLFSTGYYLYEAWREIVPNLEIKFIPGISAHSLAAACARKFLVMSDEILSIIPGTAPPEKIYNTLRNSDAIAIYKPTALKNIRELVKATGPYEKIIRVDFAGIPDKEKVIDNYVKALYNINEYLSIILLWK